MVGMIEGAGFGEKVGGEMHDGVVVQSVCSCDVENESVLEL